MGIVSEALDCELNRKVALKTILSSRADNGRLVARFLREARAAARLTGEHSVRVLDVGRDKGKPFFVMEFLTGCDLGAILDGADRLPFAEAVHYIQQAANGVAEAHAAGIIHRDVKPRNLFLAEGPDGKPVVKVLDFGLAKAVEEERALTTTSAVIGSPEYMSPEQVRASPHVDATIDIWALGVCLYELLTGRVPFAASNSADVLVNILTAAPVAPRLVWADIPTGLSHVVMRCLEKDPAARFAHATDLIRALDEWSAGGADAARRRLRTALTRPHRRLALPRLNLSDTDSQTATTYESRPGTGRRVIASGAAVLLVLAAAIGTVARYSAHAREPHAATAPGPSAAPDPVLHDDVSTMQVVLPSNSAPEPSATATRSSAPEPAPERAVKHVAPAPKAKPRAAPAPTTPTNDPSPAGRY